MFRIANDMIIKPSSQERAHALSIDVAIDDDVPLSAVILTTLALSLFISRLILILYKTTEALYEYVVRHHNEVDKL